MKYGYFDDKAKEYVITTPHTPLPWINYLGSNDFFSLISNTCGGYSFYKDAKLMRITRYRYNNIPVDSNGKYYYINDDGVIWNPGTMPSMTRQIHMNVAMDWATVVSILLRINWKQIFWHLYHRMQPVRLTA